MRIKRKAKTICLILLAIVLLISIYLNTFLLIKYNVLPMKYLLVYFGVVVLIPLISIFFTVFKRLKSVIKIILVVIEIIYIIVLFWVFSYLNNTFNFLNEFTNKYDYETKNYYILVLKDSNYQKINDLENKKIGYVQGLDKSVDKAIDDFDKKIKLEHEEFTTFTEVFESLYNNELDGILIIDSFYNLLSEEDETITEKTKIIYKFSIREPIDDISKNVDVTKEPFNIYISGIGTYGSVTDKGLSDVNMLISINPQTYQVLMLNIPRDYFVELDSIGQKDKLTHAGMYGVETSVKTIENLLGIEINYYIKVNYNALINLVDVLDGVDVYSEYDFYSAEFSYKFNKGYNHVNGKQALDFVRTRKAFIGGDRVRGENQQAMIQAILKKVLSKTILIKYNDILKVLENSFTTNISSDKIMSLVNMQLDKMPSWNITTISLDGSDSYEFTYTYPTQELYVMIPKEETIEDALKLLNEVINN